MRIVKKTLSITCRYIVVWFLTGNNELGMGVAFTLVRALRCAGRDLQQRPHGPHAYLWAWCQRDTPTTSTIYNFNCLKNSRPTSASWLTFQFTFEIVTISPASTIGEFSTHSRLRIKVPSLYRGKARPTLFLYTTDISRINWNNVGLQTDD